MEYRVFKGATRPPMFMGVPLMPMICLAAPTVLPLGFTVIFNKFSITPFFAAIFLVGFLWMRIISKKDAWRTKQEVMRLQIRFRKGNSKIWGGISYAPFALKHSKAWTTYLLCRPR